MLENKRIFITGGANGIGRGLVQAFCRQQAKVVFCDVNDINAEKLCCEMKDYSCRYIKTDVSDANELKATLDTLLSEWGDIDIIINNAGVSLFKPIERISIEEFDEIIDINLRPVFITSKILAQHREKQQTKNDYGRIINIASTRYLMSEPDSEAYAASKGGIVSLTHALAISLSKYHIIVNCISPGWIDTGHYGELKESDHKQHPSGRVGVTEDISKACLFLCDPGNDFINGQNITIDGGMTKKMIYEE